MLDSTPLLVLGRRKVLWKQLTPETPGQGGRLSGVPAL